jgi:hypothetical protein
MATFYEAKPEVALNETDEKQTIAEQPLVTYTEDEEKKLLRKLDWRLIPVVSALENRLPRP